MVAFISLVPDKFLRYDWVFVHVFVNGANRRQYFTCGSPLSEKLCINIHG